MINTIYCFAYTIFIVNYLRYLFHLGSEIFLPHLFYVIPLIFLWIFLTRNAIVEDRIRTREKNKKKK